VASDQQKQNRQSKKKGFGKLHQKTLTDGKRKKQTGRMLGGRGSAAVEKPEKQSIATQKKKT